MKFSEFYFGKGRGDARGGIIKSKIRKEKIKKES